MLRLRISITPQQSWTPSLTMTLGDSWLNLTSWWNPSSSSRPTGWEIQASSRSRSAQPRLVKWDVTNIPPLGYWHCEPAPANRTILDEDKTSSLLLLLLQLAVEFQAIKSNRFSLACTSVTYGTFSSVRILMFFCLCIFICHNYRPWGNRSFMSVCVCVICFSVTFQTFTLEISRRLLWPFKANQPGSAHRLKFSCCPWLLIYKLHECTVFLQNPAAEMWQDFQIFSPKLSGMQLQ